jgi:hypothetical protein
MIRLWHWILLLLLGGAAAAVSAHELSMAEMDVRQVSPTEFVWQWTASGGRPAGTELKPVWPDGCQPDGNLLRCGPGGLRGSLSVDGVGKRYSAALVKVHWLDGRLRVHTITAAQPSIRLYGSADDERGMGEIAWAYTVLGVEHILSGVDHLLFVVALLFLVGFGRRLFWTITAFTVAHSVTLALSALDLIVLRSAPVEAAIALSIVLVAGEALHRRATLSRRWPELVAFLFGLVHGLGFAGALKEIGLPQHQLVTALLTFNLGVEIGQLFVVALAYLLYRAAASWPAAALARVPALYAIGATAAYWSFWRVSSIVV